MPRVVRIREIDENEEERARLIKIELHRMEYKIDYKRELRGKIKEGNGGKGNEKET